MKYTAELRVADKSGLVYKAFMPDAEQAPKGRSEYNVVNEDGFTRFIVSAEDSIALRATLNSIVSMFTVIEKMMVI